MSVVKPQPFPVLVVDDDAAIREAYRQILQPPASELGNLEALISGDEVVPVEALFEVFEVFEADQGELAASLQQQRLARGERFPLAFIDMRMPPGWDGLRTAIALRKQDPSIYLVIATAFSDYDVNALQHELGHDVVLLRKPFNQEEVYQLARTLCQSWQARQRLEAVTADMEEQIRRRTVELERRNTLQTVLIEIAARFIEMDPNDAIDDAVNWSLARLGRGIDVDFCVLYRFDAAQDVYLCIHHWHALGIEGLADSMLRIPRAAIAPVHASFLHGESFDLANVDLLLPEMAQLRALVGAHHASCLAVPLEVGGRLLGYFSVGMTQAGVAWDAGLSPVLRSAGHTIMRALETFDINQKLNISQALLRATQHAGHIGSWRLEAENQAIWWDAELIRISGIDSGQQPGMHLLESLVVAEDWPRLSAALASSLENGEPMHIEFRIQRPDGAKRWVTSWAEAQRDKDGRIVGLIGIAQDVTAYQQSEQVLREEREKLRFILDLAPIGIWMQDGNGRIDFINRALCASFGIPESTFLAVPHYAELIPEPYRDQCLASDEKALASGSVSESIQRFQLVDGHIHDLRVIKSVKRDAEGKPLALIGISLDITDELAQQQALRDSELKLHTMLDWNHDVEYWVGPDGHFRYLTPSVERLTGYPPVVFIESPELINQIVHSQDKALWDAHRQFFNNGGAAVRETDLRIVRQDGSSLWVSHTSRQILDDDGNSLGLRVTLRDIDARKMAEQNVRSLAYFDSLTGLPNRRLLMDRLDHALVASRRSREYGALIMLDLDYFKVLNDTHGHDIGDLMLIEVAQRMQQAVRQGDTVARLGGDEYVVVLETLEIKEQAAARLAEAVAEKVRAALAAPYLLAGLDQEYLATASLGLTLFGGGDSEQSADSVLKQADVALYQAKHAGRNVVRFFNPAMQAAIDANIAMENALRRGIDNGELQVFYQPQVNQHGEQIGAEALLRWLPPDAEPVPAAQFIPLAEITGLILPVGKWVFDTAFAELKSWETQPDKAGLRLAVNISARQFQQPDFVREISETLSQSGADPARLILELSESALLVNIEESMLRMHELRAMGINFSMDDFGTGYSSLACLKRLPLDQIKIDQSLVRDLLHDADDAAIVRAILAMCQSFGINVIAEGVETEAQRDFLRANGCTCFQGYLFGKPLPMRLWER